MVNFYCEHSMNFPYFPFSDLQLFSFCMDMHLIEIYSQTSPISVITTVIVEIFALYIFSRNSHILDIHKNMYIVKINCIRPHRDNIKNANIDLREILIFGKLANMYTCENIYVLNITHAPLRGRAPPAAGRSYTPSL